MRELWLVKVWLWVLTSGREKLDGCVVEDDDVSAPDWLEY